MNRFPDFNKWHKVPADADIPAQTPFFVAEDGVLRSYIATEWSAALLAEDRYPGLDYYTKEPILSPTEEKIEKRARDMFYSIPDGDAWEYKDEYTQDAWRDLARKYVEKED